jgi:ParB family transcriptional regulator, chromosome partitioning protein
MDDEHVTERVDNAGAHKRQVPIVLQSSRGIRSCAIRIVEVNPFRCRVWTMHDRIEEHITEESCANEIKSFAAHGQLIPAVGRPIRDKSGHDVEIICGARRLFVARHLNVPLRVDLQEMSDRQAIVAMDLENRHRKDVSAYERGLSYSHWLRGQFFSSQDDLARALNVSASQVSRLLKLTQLPSVVLSAFPSPMAIRECWGLNLYRAWQDPQLRSCLALRARALVTSPCIDAEKVYMRLMAPSGKRAAPRHASHDEVVRSSEGAPLFRIRRHRGFVALLVPVERISEAVLKRIRLAIAEELIHPLQ